MKKRWLFKLFTLTPYSWVNLFFHYAVKIARIFPYYSIAKKKQINAFIQEISGRPASSAELEQYLFNSTVRAGRYVAFAVENLSRNKSWVKIEGLEFLEQADKNNKGKIIINSHYGFQRCIPFLMAQLGYKTHSLEAGNIFSAVGVTYPNLTIREIGGKDVFLAKEAFIAKKVLDKGNVVCLCPDGYFGSSGEPRNFLGRSRRFATGFADLAAATEASVIPVTATVDTHGHCLIRFFPPLPTIDQKDSNSIEILTSHYVRFLEDIYTHDPSNIGANHIKRFLKLPCTDKTVS